LTFHYQPEIGSLDFDDLSTADAIHFNIVLARTRTDGEDMQKCERSCFFSAAHAPRRAGSLSSWRNLGLDLSLARDKGTVRPHDR